ncbi:vitamin K epoxide reductase family protein [Microtetraspora malaysiensis]|uniref:vitamin K epoxide reductase family protein n=1 Tax=Microtetraspora malaysiensis TaxID=161358 RepID=UPI00082A4680|nr:vitamin K epoxide reductase family protein [Microtetraspora malaysiensis]
MLLSPADTAQQDRAGFPRLLPVLLLVGGLIGLAAAFALTVEKIALLKDPDYVPSCSINPVLSCGSIMKTPQAELFGFPNPLLGVASFAVLVTVGAALLAGARFHRWFWYGLQLGATLGVVFVHWLIYQSLFVIGALCPYCMIVWAVTIPTFVYVTLRNFPARRLTRYHSVIVALWFLAVITLILIRFWSYWSSLI